MGDTRRIALREVERRRPRMGSQVPDGEVGNAARRAGERREYLEVERFDP